MMHPRLSLHQVAFLPASTPEFIAFCREAGFGAVTLANPHALGPDALAATKAALARDGIRATALVQPFARYPDLPRDSGEAAIRLNEAIEAATELGAGHIYIISGGRGSLDWEAAAARCAELIAPCRALAEAKGIALSVETANLLTAEMHIAHTLDDTLRLAEIAGIGITLDFGAIWAESDLRGKFGRALPLTRLVQVCDYVEGDRSTPCKAVPGDGMIPIERMVGDLLELGYSGLFDLELVGERIAAEGAAAASRRAGEYMSELLTRLGA